MFLIVQLRLPPSLLLVIACIGGQSLEGTSTTTVTTTTTMATTTTAAPTTTADPDAAAPELEGVWLTELANGETIRLTLRRTSYQINRGANIGAGKISVDDGNIEFYDSNLCSEVGDYTWSIEDNTLTFVPAPDDPCGNRREVLVEVTYVLDAPLS